MKNAIFVSLFLSALGASALPAQELTATQDVKAAIRAPLPRDPAIQVSKSERHRFWDHSNTRLFAGVGASRALDYFSTLNMRRRGRQELLISNDAVDNHAAFAIIETAGTGISIGASYLFHRAGHHKLERWTSIVHLSLAIAGAASNYSLKTAQQLPVHAP